MLSHKWKRTKNGKEPAKQSAEESHEDIEDVLASLDSSSSKSKKWYDPMVPNRIKYGVEDNVKKLYEGPQKCSCCINWVEEYPDNLRENLLATNEVKQHAIVTKYMRNHKGDKPLVLHSIDIQSSILKVVLEEVFEGYSGITTGLDNLSFAAPFQAFFRRLDRLEEGSRNRDDPKALYQTKLLYEIINNELKESVEIFKDLVAHKVITFEYLWALFTPGEMIRTEKDRIFLLNDADYGNSGGFTLWVRFIDWDGTQFGYDRATISIPKFDGTRPITDLEGYPASFDPGLDGVKATLVMKGKKFEELQGFHYMAHRGMVVEANAGVWSFGSETRHVEGRIIVDAGSYFRFNPHEVKSLKSLDDQGKLLEIPGMLKNTDIHNSTFTSSYDAHYGSYNRTPREVTKPYRYSDEYDTAGLKVGKKLKIVSASRPLTDNELILCTQSVRGFSLKTKHWASFAVADISNIKWDENAFESLVLPSNYKQLILSFVEGQLHYKDDFDDVIEGKGRGIIILLAGVPGVGKTLTAESVAETLRAPLYSMTAGELSLDATNLEESLTKILEISTKWNSVLLLDEADVFLEQRSSSHLERNKLVSIFLRMLEYYRGILFLTTNRLSAFDSAFQSRIHITINYPPLSSSARSQIWRNFLLLAPNKPKPSEPLAPDISVSESSAPPKAAGTTSDVQTLVPDSHHTRVETHAPLLTSISEAEIMKLAEIDLNGRQIKNVVKTSRLLARRLGKSLGIEEVNTVLEATSPNLLSESIKNEIS